MAVTIAIVLFGIGLVGVVLRRDLVIKLLALGLINSASILFLVAIADRPNARAPIQQTVEGLVYADPLPQALVLSAIVINFAILALALVFVMLLVERYHTTDSQRIERETAKEGDDNEDGESWS
jgi:multicomponent Na+:H+ antiporter subunit C